MTAALWCIAILGVTVLGYLIFAIIKYTKETKENDGPRKD